MIKKKKKSSLDGGQTNQTKFRKISKIFKEKFPKISNTVLIFQCENQELSVHSANQILALHSEETTCTMKKIKQSYTYMQLCGCWNNAKPI